MSGERTHVHAVPGGTRESLSTLIGRNVGSQSRACSLRFFFGIEKGAERFKTETGDAAVVVFIVEPPSVEIEQGRTGGG
jgi:hypothetical protein